MSEATNGKAMNGEAMNGEAMNREAMNREATNREAANREAANREALNREATNREALNREAANREAANREAANREAMSGEAMNGEAMNGEAMNEVEIRDRIVLIESMMSEGRKKTESWGWSFVLWGVAYYVATAWATLGHSNWAWPVTMVVAAALTAAVPVLRKREAGRTETTIGRAIGAVWMGMGSALFLVCMVVGFSGHAEQHALLTTIEGFVGAANVISAIILRWRVQLLVGILWWVAAGVTAFVSIQQTGYIFLAAIFFCQIVFGVYMMISEGAGARTRAASAGARHA